ncbi:MAG: hypothetical protein JW834_01610 [Candidatus Diapherotrites archaeon]|nr:hypothetical protein [Candidatus Diapherotrites archaeon]
MRKLFALLLLASAFGACDISSDAAQEIHSVFSLNKDRSAFFFVQMTIPASDECLQQAGMESVKQAPLTCSTDEFQDYVFQHFGEKFVENAYCQLNYSEGSVVFEISGRVLGVMSGSLDEYEFTVTNWTASRAQEGVIDTLTIYLPENAENVMYYPKKDSARDGKTIYWSQIPLEKPRISFRVETAMQHALPTTAAAALAIVVIVWVAWLYFKRAAKPVRISAAQGTSVLIEGPPESEKHKVARSIIEDYAKQGKKTTIICFDRKVACKYYEKADVVQAVEDLNELNATLSKVAQSKPDLVVVRALYRIMPKEPFDRVQTFVTRNLKRFKDAGATIMFIEESDGYKEKLALIEPLFDTVVSVTVKEEGNELASYMSLKRFEGVGAAKKLERVA